MMAVTVALLLGFLGLVFLWSKKAFSYFRRRGFPEDPGYFPVGSRNLIDGFAGKISIADTTQRAYTMFDGAPYVGYYGILGQRFLVVNDMELIKRILIKDFDYFHDRRPFNLDKEVNKYMASMLINLTGERWKEMRSVVSPSFTSGKLKTMFPLMQRVANEMVAFLRETGAERGEVEAKDMMFNYALDVIATTTFGIETNSFKEPDNTFKDMVNRITQTGKYKPTFWQFVKMSLPFFLPGLGSLFRTPFFDPVAEQFFVRVIKSQIKDRREGPGGDEGPKRNDLIDTLITTLNNVEQAVEVAAQEDAKQQNQFERDAVIGGGSLTKRHQKLSSFSQEEMEDIIVSNALVFFLGGFDTTSTGLTSCLFHLGANQGHQAKLFEEVQDAVTSSGGDPDSVSYSTIQGMEYMEMVFQESLRMFPLAVLERNCAKDYRIPGTDLVIEAGTIVQVPAPQIMKDEKYFKNAATFDPEHFSAEAKAERGPYPALSFGHGPRNCVGMRYAVLSVKVALFYLLLNYRILPSERSKELRHQPGSLNMLPPDGVWVRVETRNN